MPHDLLNKTLTQDATAPRLYKLAAHVTRGLRGHMAGSTVSTPAT
jgi:hypothetical protein